MHTEPITRRGTVFSIHQQQIKPLVRTGMNQHHHPTRIPVPSLHHYILRGSDISNVQQYHLKIAREHTAILPIQLTTYSTPHCIFGDKYVSNHTNTSTSSSSSQTGQIFSPQPKPPSSSDPHSNNPLEPGETMIKGFFILYFLHECGRDKSR